MILAKGKYAGMTLAEVYHSDFNYFTWLSKTDMVTKTDLSSFDFDAADYAIPFGKYSKQRISSIHAKDPNYFNFLKSKVSDFKNERLAEAIKYYSAV